MMYTESFCIMREHPKKFAACYEARGYLPPLEYPEEVQLDSQYSPSPDSIEHLQKQVDLLRAQNLRLQKKINEHLDYAKKPKNKGSAF